MTASTEQPRARRERRIIERPRLMKMLDECEARVILLHAPAGYGKTTLARQWAKTLSGAVWVTLTNAHRDVARFAEDVAIGIDRIAPDGARSFIAEYLRARNNPQRAARHIGLTLGDRMESIRTQWLVLDDYHEADSHELHALITAVEEQSTARLLVATRQRPLWATQRRIVYGEIDEIDRDALALNAEESLAVVGARADLREIMSLADGWPAVLGLAAATSELATPSQSMPTELYAYIAEEVYQSVPIDLREALHRIALVPELLNEANDESADLSELIGCTRRLGFLSEAEPSEIHPLMREFLTRKLCERSGAVEESRKAVGICLQRSWWDRAFELVVRFRLDDLMDATLEAAYKPLVRSGHLGTLSGLVSSTRTTGGPWSPLLDLVESEVVLWDGNYQLAADLAERARSELGAEHPLSSRASAVVAQSSYAQSDVPRTQNAYREAYESATDDRDATEALYGWALATIQSEADDPQPVLAELERRSGRTPLDLVRRGSVEIARRRFGEGLAAPLGLEQAIHALPRVEDPRARSSLLFSLAYVFGVMGRYREAQDYAERSQAEVDRFDLEFARLHSLWNLAFVALGLRRFGAVERYLQQIEDASLRRPSDYHGLNVRILRARLALQTGQLQHALGITTEPAQEISIPSLHGELLATRAIVLAVCGERRRAADAATEALAQTSAIEVKVLAQAALSITSEDLRASCVELFDRARELGAWDPVVTALRCAPDLTTAAASIPTLKRDLELLFERSNDLALARRTRIRVRAKRPPDQVLSPRELEVLGLIARGFRNAEIAHALVISESTTKVHIRHILEKLGVRTRAEAVARFRPSD